LALATVENMLRQLGDGDVSRDRERERGMDTVDGETEERTLGMILRAPSSEIRSLLEESGVIMDKDGISQREPSEGDTALHCTALQSVNLFPIIPKTDYLP
jgi:hypothetical protein